MGKREGGQLGVVRGASLALLAAACAAAGCAPAREHKLEGQSMGTTYHVTVVTRGTISGLQEKIDGRLEEIERSLSTYREESEISRFNRLSRVGEEFPVSGDFVRVMRAGARVFALSGGAWDGTVRPLVDLWGFGPAGAAGAPPAADRIAARLADVGFSKIEVRPGGLVKRQASVSVDLSSIAPGYGVDQVAELLRREGFSQFIVEIGGEVYAAGSRRDGRDWRVGIGRPLVGAAPDDFYRVAPLRDAGFSTSGDYRSFFVRDGVRYSHILDPRTGRPISNGVVSVSILAPDCTLADGLSTAVMVMGADAGLALVERLEGVEGLVVVETKDGRLEDHASSGFRSEPPS